LTHAAKVRDEQKSFCDCNWFMNKEQPWESLLPLPAEDDDQQKGPLNGNVPSSRAKTKGLRRTHFQVRSTGGKWGNIMLRSGLPGALLLMLGTVPAFPQGVTPATAPSPVPPVIDEKTPPHSMSTCSGPTHYPIPPFQWGKSSDSN